MQKGPQMLPSEAVKEAKFSPYVNNGGTCIGVAGKDFAVVAADTRMSSGYSILTRDSSKLCQLTGSCVLASSGMQADMTALHRNLKARLTWYRLQHHKDASAPAVAQMLGNTLYYKRFFPYYTFNVLAGVDADGVGCVYSYDAVGSFERTQYSASGSGQQLMIPLMDNQVGRKNVQLPRQDEMTAEEVVELLRDAFCSATERDIYTGDAVEISVIRKGDDGKVNISTQRFDLKQD